MSEPENLSASEILSTTRSVRRQIDFEREVDPQTLLECIDISVQAPTGAGTESWRYMVVTDIDKKIRIANYYRRAFDDYLSIRKRKAIEDGVEPQSFSPNYRYLADHLQNFPALIFVCQLGRPPTKVAEQFGFYGSILPAAWSLMVALRERRLGSTWTTVHGRYEAEIAEILTIPSDVTIAVLLPVGHMRNASLKPAKRTAAKKVTYFDQWENEHQGE